MKLLESHNPSFQYTFRMINDFKVQIKAKLIKSVYHPQIYSVVEILMV
jgi:hypothetical protein